VFRRNKYLEEIKHLQDLLLERASPPLIKVVNFYSAIFDDLTSPNTTSGTLLDYSGREFTFEWDTEKNQLSSLVAPNDSLLLLRWELAVEYLEEQFQIPTEEEFGSEEILREPTMPPLDQAVALPVGDPNDHPSGVEVEDLSDEEISRAFENLSPNDVISDDRDKKIEVGDRVQLEADSSLKGMVRSIREGVATVFIDANGDLNVPLGDLRHEGKESDSEVI
jgi:hypothetical protein